MEDQHTANQGRMIFADTHCHLDFQVFDEDREDVLATARESGVRYFINPSIDLDSSRKVVMLAQGSRDIFAATGVHPNDALTWNGDTNDQLRSLSQHTKVVAIGEIGLDYYRDRAPKDVQQKVFQAQLELAETVNLPVIIHTRQSITDTLAILKEWIDGLRLTGSKLVDRPGVLHSFSGNEHDADLAFGLGFRIGITGPVTFRNAPELQRIVTNSPLSKLVLETDAPFLTPHPYRGQRNQPANVRYVAEKISTLRGISLEDVARITTASAKELFFGENLVE